MEYKKIFFWATLACGILVPQPGIEPVPRAVEAPSPNHWTAREVPKTQCFLVNIVSNGDQITCLRWLITSVKSWEIILRVG